MEPVRTNLIAAVENLVTTHIRKLGIGNNTSSARNNPQTFLNLPATRVSIIRHVDFTKTDVNDFDGFGNYIEMGDYE